MRRVFREVRVVVAFAASAVLVSTVPASALGTAPVPRVLVMPFTAHIEAGAPGGAGAALWLGPAAAMLISEGLTSAGVATLDRDERVAAFARLDLPLSPSLSRATMIRVAELLGVSEVVFGEVRLGSELEVHARLIHVLSGQEGPAVADEAPLADIFPLFGRVTSAIAQNLGRSVPPSHATAAPLPLDAFENYMKGLVAPTPVAEQRFLEEAAKEAPADARVLMALWHAYNTLAMPEKALAAANAVPAGSPLIRSARFAVGISLIALKRLDGAFETLTALDSTGPAAAISNALGVVELRRGEGSGAHSPTTYFMRAADEDPANPDYLFNLGYAYALAGDAAHALQWLRDAVRFDATNGDAHLVMSAVLSAAGRGAEAGREFDLARQLGTRLGPAVAPAGKVPTGLERLSEALDMDAVSRLNAAIADPAKRDEQATADFHLARARTLLAAARTGEATDELRRAIYLAPYQDEPHLLLGRIYERAGRSAEAIDEFKVALWCRETADAHLALGDALLAAGSRDEARREATRALELSPSSPAARDLLQRIGG